MSAASTIAPAAKRTKTFPVIEIFGPTIQGEGAEAGLPTHFVRLGGCDYRCSWCDSLHAVLPEYRGRWTKLSAGEILAQVYHLAPPPMMITLSGGNPAIHSALDSVVEHGKEADALLAVPRRPGPGKSTRRQPGGF